MRGTLLALSILAFGCQRDEEERPPVDPPTKLPSGEEPQRSRPEQPGGMEETAGMEEMATSMEETAMEETPTPGGPTTEELAARERHAREAADRAEREVNAALERDHAWPVLGPPRRLAAEGDPVAAEGDPGQLRPGLGTPRIP